MASTAPGQDQFTVLDQLIVRALVSLRLARAAYGQDPTPRGLDLRERAGENLDALLDARSGARRRASAAERAAAPLPA